jgi:CTP synthase (UTP-ammonia lyase)
LDRQRADITLIEVGGTVGDLEGAMYFEAIRQLILRIGS